MGRRQQRHAGKRGLLCRSQLLWSPKLVEHQDLGIHDPEQKGNGLGFGTAGQNVGGRSQVQSGDAVLNGPQLPALICHTDPIALFAEESGKVSQECGLSRPWGRDDEGGVNDVWIYQFLCSGGSHALVLSGDADGDRGNGFQSPEFFLPHDRLTAKSHAAAVFQGQI